MKYVFMQPSYSKNLDFYIGKAYDEVDGEEIIMLYDLIGVDEGEFFKDDVSNLLVKESDLYDSLQDVMRKAIPFIFGAK